MTFTILKETYLSKEGGVGSDCLFAATGGCKGLSKLPTKLVVFAAVPLFSVDSKRKKKV